VAALFLTVVGCASTAPVNMNELRRVVGTEDAVRVDAEIRSDELRSGVAVPIIVEITNHRSVPIAIADIVSETTYDRETHTVTVSVGSEMPGATLLPRLIAIAPGEKKVIPTSARLAFIAAEAPTEKAARTRYPNALRLKVNFLGDTKPFAELVGISQKAINDPKRADELFPVWLEHTEVVYTNTVPMRWRGPVIGGDAPITPPAARRRTTRG
jgi:hypothetical protein